MAAGLSDEIDAIGDVEEAVDLEARADLRQRRVAGARQTEVRSAGDPQQIEVGIAGRKLPLQPEHVGGERLHRRAGRARTDVGFEAHRDLERAIEARERSRSL
jgi:hypothetical protein